MNVYDFDGTIYDGDSTFDFYRYAIARHPRLFITLFTNGANALLFALKKIDRDSFKQRFFESFLPKIDAPVLVRSFWKARFSRIKQWYLNQRNESDVIISASPQFLLEPICTELRVTVIASSVDPGSGKLLKPNLKGRRKVDAFRAVYGTAIPDEFYSDDMSDRPMMEYSKTAYLVKGSYITRILSSHK